MFAHPGSYIGSEILLRFWKNLKTQTESKDPAAPGMYIVREESSPSKESEQGIPRTEEPIGLEEPAISLVEMALEVERLRERSAQEDSSLLKTPASLQDITMITEAQEISGKTPTEKISPEALAEVPFMFPIAEEIEPQLEKEPEPKLHKIGVVHLRQEFPYGDIFIIQY